MNYDEFLDRLREYREEYRAAYGRELKTIDQLEEYLSRRKTGRVRRSGRRALKSLRGFGL